MISADPSESGYLRIVDFGLAKFLKEGETADSFAGTPDYVAPEIVLRKGYDHSVDWWTVGILAYEMIVGMPPFYSRDQSQAKLFTKIVGSKPCFDFPQKYNISMSPECIDFITGLL